ncbi:tyrosine-type recombinase/integrase [Brevibacillus sp. JB24b]|uniref:tyrosine-type recombinase/integrase n=1 Tax=Brevibacillus sp. JB24b TaxID=3422308 RepID=UPI003F6824E8
MEYVEPIRDAEQINTMRIILRDKTKRDEVMFVLGIRTGLRISDILPLLVPDVVVGRGRTARVKTELTITETKTGKKKTVELHDEVRKLIKEYLLGAKNLDWSGFLFPSQKPNKHGHYSHITRQMAWKIMSGTAKKIGLPRIGTHTLRKTFGYHAYMSGVPIETIQYILNHDNKYDTLRYIGITQDEAKRVYRTLIFQRAAVME